MKIYKLSDEVVEDAKKDSVSSVHTDLLTITELKQGVKNPNRVNVFVNSEFAFSLDIKQVVDLGVKVGLEISEEKLAELKKASEFGKLYQRALEWVLVRPRSEKELKDYLFRKKAEESDKIIDLLIKKGYVDDRKFAEYYVENRFVKKGISQKRLRMELAKKGISKEIIDEVVSGRDDNEEIDKIIAKKRSKYDDEKLISYLCRQGFSYQLAQSRVLDFGKD